MEEYLSTLLSQIRCEKARNLVNAEIRGHIEDQAEENRKKGMSEAQALEAAVKDMGDPVEAGVMLDQIHRPQAAWGMILLMAVISLVSVLIHVVIGINADDTMVYSGRQYILRSAGSVLIGFGAMLAVYRIDYSFMGKFAKIIAAVCVIFLALLFFVPGLSLTLNGSIGYIPIGSGTISIKYGLLLLVPIYGALLYQYRGSGYKGLLKSLLWMFSIVFLTICLPAISMAAELLLMMGVLLTMAVWKGWFGTARKRILAAFWSVAAGGPMLLAAQLFLSGRLAGYQTERFRYFLSGDTSKYDYTGTMLKSCLTQMKVLGAGEKSTAVTVPCFNSDYILTFLGTFYGLIAAILVCLVLLFVTFRIFRISIRQKNQLGMIMGCGCGLVFLVSILTNIAQNLSLLPRMGSFLPLFSFGGTGIVVCYVLIGIILSVYRYKNVLPVHLGESAAIGRGQQFGLKGGDQSPTEM
ncbi:MAG: FtsW/RodA/SpoVE family cell cycle protein [Lachnospiraceae bacterium]|nr:FtsW/RodA/SpoVE family cell cycle protein [Lachnospiraceae bacterium]